MNEPITSITDLMTIFQTNSSNELMVTSYNLDDGVWTKATPLINGLTGSNPVLATYNSMFYAAYQPWNGKVVGQLYMATSADGLTWTNSSGPICTNIGGPHCAMTEHNGTLFIIYQEINSARLCTIYLNEYGEWTAPAYISSYTTQTGPAVTSWNGLLYLVYQDTKTMELMLMTSTDGATWSAPTAIFGSTQACNPSITSFREKLYVAYQPWDGKVVGQMYIGWYGAGVNWQHSVSPIITNIGGPPPVIAHYDDTLQIVYQEINSARLCFTSSTNGTTWSSGVYVNNDITVTGPAARSTFTTEVRRELQAITGPIVPKDPNFPKASSITFSAQSDAEYNWKYRAIAVPQRWGLTGIVNWRDCVVKDGSTWKAGTLFIFPGNRLTMEQYEEEYPGTKYGGKAMINGKEAQPFYRITTDPAYKGSLHGQVCNALKPDNVSLEDFMFNFLGFAYDGGTPTNLKYGSISLNQPHFKFSNTGKSSAMMNADWLNALKKSLNAFFKL